MTTAIGSLGCSSAIFRGRAKRRAAGSSKSPEHVFSIDALTGVFPDAMLVLVHRDPGHVLVSAARLTELLRAPFTTTIDRREIGRKVAGCGRRDAAHGQARRRFGLSTPARARQLSCARRRAGWNGRSDL
jgi:hypothetical protein